MIQLVCPPTATLCPLIYHSSLTHPHYLLLYTHFTLPHLCILSDTLFLSYSAVFPTLFHRPHYPLCLSCFKHFLIHLHVCLCYLSLSLLHAPLSVFPASNTCHHNTVSCCSYFGSPPSLFVCVSDIQNYSCPSSICLCACLLCSSLSTFIFISCLIPSPCSKLNPIPIFISRKMKVTAQEET